jgi:hypothetical protein
MTHLHSFIKGLQYNPREVRPLGLILGVTVGRMTVVAIFISGSKFVQFRDEHTEMSVEK